MIMLKITEKGHYIEIPGMSPFRSPVEANISHVSINLVVSRLKAQGIKKFEIVSDTKGKETVMTQNDFKTDNRSLEKRKEDNYEKRFNKLELLIAKLVNKKVGDTTPVQEQITNKLSSIEELLKKKATTKVVHVTEKKSKKKDKRNEPIVEEMEDIFIPDINIDGLHMRGNGTQEIIEQDKADIDDSADLLSRIMQSDE